MTHHLQVVEELMSISDGQVVLKAQRDAGAHYWPPLTVPAALTATATATAREPCRGTDLATNRCSIFIGLW